MQKYEITKNNANMRLDKFVATVDNTLSRTAIQRLIDKEKILVNNRTQKASYKVLLGDKVTVEKEEPKEIDLVPQKIPLEIVYEDADIIVVNKPKGLVVHPANGNPDGTLVNAVLSLCKDTLSGIGGEIRPGIVHRLDKDTSGLIIVAKNDKAHINLSNQIKNREINKVYFALVRGFIKENEATINMPIGRSIKDRKKMAVSKKGKEAITHFKVLERYKRSNFFEESSKLVTEVGQAESSRNKDYTFIEIKIDTGRTHQIRVHMANIGYPVVGDVVYSNGKNPFGVTGQMLHAGKIEFRHPTTNELVSLETPLPEYFKRILDELCKK